MKALTKQEVKNVIEGKRTTERIPNHCAFWIFSDNFKKSLQKEIADWLNQQVYDMDVVFARVPEITKGTDDAPEYCWLPANTKKEIGGAIDHTVYPYGTPEEVRKEVRFLIDTFDRPDGRFMITLGNATTPDWTKESLEALYDEIAQFRGH